MTPFPFPNGIVFLDVDGVLNTEAYVREHGPDGLDPKLVYQLDRLVTATKAKIVVSSWWRVNDMPKAMTKFRRLLSAAGFQNLDAIVDATPHIRQYAPHLDAFKDIERGHEIDLWFDLRGLPRSWSKFIVLDDNLIGRKHAMHLVRTNPEMGLQDEDINRAVKIFSDLTEAHAAQEIMALVYRENA